MTDFPRIHIETMEKKGCVIATVSNAETNDIVSECIIEVNDRTDAIKLMIEKWYVPSSDFNNYLLLSLDHTLRYIIYKYGYPLSVKLLCDSKDNNVIDLIKFNFNASKVGDNIYILDLLAMIDYFRNR